MEQQAAVTAKGKNRVLFGAVVVALICLGSGIGVGVVYYLLKDGIAAKERQAFDAALAVVLGEGEHSAVGQYTDDVPPEERVYSSTTSSGVLYAAIGSAQGYSSIIKVAVSVIAPAPNVTVGDNPRIHKMTVLSSQETPGLGENIKAVQKEVSIWEALLGKREQPRQPRFQEQFSGLRLNDLGTGEDLGKVEALTGATITSLAATKAVRQAVQKIVSRTREVYGQ